jgi:ABC-type antimicrobial peptide transport system permease subunit
MAAAMVTGPSKRSLVFAGVMGLVGGMFPAVRAARMNILEALRG